MSQATKNKINRVVVYLSKQSDFTASTLDILDYLNSTLRNGVTMPEVSNMLAQSPKIGDTGRTIRQHRSFGSARSYKVWTLSRLQELGLEDA